jgi:phenylacetic acid degradation operon negative regulatory protein
VARVESFELGGAAIRQLLLDPLLPEPIAPEAERRALLESMRRYDSLGRRVWRGWLGDGAAAASEGLPAGVSGRRTGLALAAVEA